VRDDDFGAWHRVTYLPIKHYWTSYIFALSLFSAASQVWKTIEAKFMATVWRSVAGMLIRASS
jgi:hypothetical protein